MSQVRPAFKVGGAYTVFNIETADKGQLQLSLSLNDYEEQFSEFCQAHDISSEAAEVIRDEISMFVDTWYSRRRQASPEKPEKKISKTTQFTGTTSCTPKRIDGGSKGRKLVWDMMEETPYKDDKKCILLKDLKDLPFRKKSATPQQKQKSISKDKIKNWHNPQQLKESRCKEHKCDVWLKKQEVPKTKPKQKKSPLPADHFHSTRDVSKGRCKEHRCIVWEYETNSGGREQPKPYLEYSPSKKWEKRLRTETIEEKQPYNLKKYVGSEKCRAFYSNFKEAYFKNAK